MAYNIVSPELLRIRARLAGNLEALLTRQDQAPFRPHVTVQNKVEPAKAAALLERLQHDFETFEARGEALLLWRYLGGPWGAEGRYAFAS